MRSHPKQVLAVLGTLSAMIALTACSNQQAATAEGAAQQEDRIVIIARHGESWTNLATSADAAGVPEINLTDDLGPIGDLPLTADGANQARQLAAELAEKVTDIHTSAQIRTFQTARAVAKAADLPIDAQWDLREISVPTDPHEMEQYFQDVYSGERLDEQFSTFGAPAESFNEAEDRWDSFWDGFVDEYAGTAGTSLIVTHGGLMSLHIVERCTNRDALTPEILATSAPYTGRLEAVLEPDGSLHCTEWMGISLE